jgi:hypothetical protein
MILYRLAEKQTELSNVVDKSPPQKYLEAMEALMKWVHNVEGVLLSEHAVVADAAVMEDQLQKFKVSHLTDLLNVHICNLFCIYSLGCLLKENFCSYI